MVVASAFTAATPSLPHRLFDQANRLHDPCLIHRIGLCRSDAGAAAVSVDRHRVRPAAATDHSTSLPSHSLRADRGPDPPDRPAIDGKSDADPVQPCVVARHLRHIGALAPVVFVAKSEVAGWPVFGWLARLQRTIFIDRKARHQTGAATREIAGRLLGGDAVVLFAEGTSSDGMRVLPFRSVAGRRGPSRARQLNASQPAHRAADVAGLCRLRRPADGPGHARSRGMVRRCRPDAASASPAGVGSRRCHGELGRGHRLRHQRGSQGNRARRRTVGAADDGGSPASCAARDRIGAGAEAPPPLSEPASLA